jgi:hypothetical protein
VLCQKSSVSACLECIELTIISFSIDGMCHGQFQHDCNKMCCTVVVIIVSFGMSGMYRVQNKLSQFLHGVDVSWSKSSLSACLECNVLGSLLTISACLECIVSKIVSFNNVWYVLYAI